MDSGVGIAITDLFISATATLLMVLALAAPDPPADLAIQADIVGFCDMPDGADPVLVLSEPQNGRELRVSEEVGLSDVPRFLGLAPSMFYNLALQPDMSGHLTATCLRWVQSAIIHTHHERLESDDYRGTRAVFSVIATLPKGDRP